MTGQFIARLWRHEPSGVQGICIAYAHNFCGGKYLTLMPDVDHDYICPLSECREVKPALSVIHESEAPHVASQRARPKLMLVWDREAGK